MHLFESLIRVAKANRWECLAEFAEVRIEVSIEMNAYLSLLSRGKSLRFLVFAAVALVLPWIQMGNCQAADEKTMTVVSSDFRGNATIPKQFTADGRDISPSLSWSGAPQRTKSFALICHDPDAPNRNWVHWVAYNIPASTTALPQGAGSPSGNSVKQGTNSFRKEGWGGPSPPAGKPHRYVFDVYALNSVLGDLHSPRDDQLRAAMSGHVLAVGQLMGVYQR